MEPQNFQFLTPNEGPPAQACGKVVFSDMHVSGAPSGGTTCPRTSGCGPSAPVHVWDEA